jgi:hypothetical protein
MLPLTHNRCFPALPNIRSRETEVAAFSSDAYAVEAVQHRDGFMGPWVDEIGTIVTLRMDGHGRRVVTAGGTVDGWVRRASPTSPIRSMKSTG